MKSRRVLPVVLAGLLQVMPMLRAVLPLEFQALAPSSWAFVLRVAGTTAALLGGYDAVSAATSIVQPYTVNATVGVAYSRQLTTSGQTAHSWSASTAPKGSAVFPLAPGLWLTNSNGKIGGVPTTPIVTNVTIYAWENSGNTGASVSAVFTITVTNSSGPSPPVITGQPQSQTNYVGGNANFSVTVTGTTPFTYQWRFNGSNITGANSSNYTRANLQTTDTGNYSVVITNSAGTATSANAALTVLVPSADLAVICAGTNSVLAGATFSYTVTVSNLGPNAASNVLLVDSLPPAAAFVSASGGGVFGGGAVAWPAIPSLASGAASSFTVTVTAPASGTLTNTASATSGTADPIAANNNGTAVASRVITTVTIPQADVSVTCAGPANVAASSAFDYIVTISNLGPNLASNIVVIDTLPPTAAFLSATGGGVFGSGSVTWPAIPSLVAGGSTSFTVTVSAPASGSLTNSASATADTADPNAANNNGTAAASRVVTSVIAPSADISVTCSGPASVASGSPCNYTITVSNLGPTAASNVVVVDTLPPAAAFSSASGGGVLGSGSVTWPAIVSLASGGSASFSLTVTAPSSGSFTNTVSGSASTPDPVASNNNGSAPSARVVTTVAAQADLAVGSSAAAFVMAGTNLTYTLAVTNLGPSPATNVVVTDRLPAGATFVSASGGGALSNTFVNWPPIPALASGAASNLTVSVSVTGSGSITNIASAVSITPDPNPANNNGTSAAAQAVTVVVPAQGQFGILPGAITWNPQTGFFEQHATVTNTAPVTAAAVRLNVGGLRAGVQLFNAAGTNAGTPFAQYNAPLNPGQTVNFLLEFYVPDRLAFTDTLQAEAVFPASTGTNASGAAAVNRVFVDSSVPGLPRFVIEFASVPGRVYTVIYSDDGTATWKVATPSVTAAASITQWYDDGPPKTASRPLSGGSRFYEVIAAPVNP